jgi:hypothetical protein
MSQITPPPRITSQPLREAFAQLGGEPEAEFKPLPLSLVVGIAFAQVAFLLVVGGVWIAFSALSTGKWILAASGQASACLGGLLGWLIARMCGARVLVCPGGLVWQRGRQVDCCRWSELQEIIANDSEKSVRIVRKEGAPWTLGSQDREEINKLRRLTSTHSVPWKSE